MEVLRCNSCQYYFELTGSHLYFEHLNEPRRRDRISFQPTDRLEDDFRVRVICGGAVILLEGFTEVSPCARIPRARPRRGLVGEQPVRHALRAERASAAVR